MSVAVLYEDQERVMHVPKVMLIDTSVFSTILVNSSKLILPSWS